MEEQFVVVRNVQNDQLYLHIEGNKFRNMIIRPAQVVVAK